MTKVEALKLIDDHKNRLLDPGDMLMWTWVRVIILCLPDDAWEAATAKAVEKLSR